LYSLHVLVNNAACAEPVPVHSSSSSSSSIDMQRLRNLRGYCGSNAGFVTGHAANAVDKVRQSAQAWMLWLEWVSLMI
jgi:hypothetical protein